MKPQNQFFLVLGAIVLVMGIALYTFLQRGQQPAQDFPATVNRDCAPWDGGAFTVSIQYDPARTIRVSIWQSPDISLPKTFDFPDDTGQIGNAFISNEVDWSDQLSGKVTFRHVEHGVPVEGEFDLTSSTGERYIGTFTAEWGDFGALCG